MSYGNDLNQHLSKVGATVADSIEYVAKQELMTGQQRDMNKLDPHPYTLEDAVLFSPADSLAEILDARQTTYGSFEDNAFIAQDIKRLMREKHNFSFAQSDQKEALDMIASKISRLLSGDIDHLDSWRDIAGYATLVADRIEGKAR